MQSFSLDRLFSWLAYATILLESKKEKYYKIQIIILKKILKADTKLPFEDNKNVK